MKTLSRARAAVVVGILICGPGAVVAFGQQSSPSQSVPGGVVGDALTVLQDLAKSVAALQASVDAIQETLDAPPAAPSKSRVSAPANLKTGTMDCVALNASSEVKEVTAEMLNFENRLIIRNRIPLNPGNVMSVGVAPGAVAAGSYWCRFSVTGGTREDIRGSLVLADVLDGTSKVVAPAD